MKKIICRALSILVMPAMALQLSACSFGWNEEYAEKYTEASLNVICTGESNSDIEFSDVAEKDYVTWRNDQIDEALETANLSSYGVSDEVTEKFKDALDKAMSKVKFEVGSATKTDDGFTVPVTIYPEKIYNGISQSAIQDELYEMFQKGEISGTDTNAIYDKTFELFADKMEENLENPSYADAYEMNIEITKDSDGKYSMTEESGVEFGLHMFDVTMS